MRLKSTVISTGMKRINQAYSQIPFQHIANKLGLPLDKVEATVAKCIRTGVVNGTIERD